MIREKHKENLGYHLGFALFQQHEITAGSWEHLREFLRGWQDIKGLPAELIPPEVELEPDMFRLSPLVQEPMRGQ